MAVTQAETQFDDLSFPRRQGPKNLADPFAQQHLVDVVAGAAGTVVVEEVGQTAFGVVAEGFMQTDRLPGHGPKRARLQGGQAEDGADFFGRGLAAFLERNSARTRSMADRTLT